MASTSFAFSNQLINRKISDQQSPDNLPRRRQLRCSASHAAAAAKTSSQTTSLSLYEILAVQTCATCQEIKSAYRKLARVLHPDVALSDGRGDATSAAEEFMRVHEAYATLSDPETRAVYDRLFLGRRRMVAGGGYSEPTRRRNNWETDQCW